MNRLSLVTLNLVVWPMTAMSDIDDQHVAAVDQMANACITDATHPEYDSDLCLAFVYGTYYQARFQRVVPIPGVPTSSGGQNLVRLPDVIDRILSTAPAVMADTASPTIPNQQMVPLQQELAPPASEIFIVPIPQSGTGGSFDSGSFGQIVQ